MSQAVSNNGGMVSWYKFERGGVGLPTYDFRDNQTYPVCISQKFWSWMENTKASCTDKVFYLHAEIWFGN
jgi:hypothetical protein